MEQHKELSQTEDPDTWLVSYFWNLQDELRLAASSSQNNKGSYGSLATYKEVVTLATYLPTPQHQQDHSRTGFHKLTEPTYPKQLSTSRNSSKAPGQNNFEVEQMVSSVHTGYIILVESKYMSSPSNYSHKVHS